MCDTANMRSRGGCKSHLFYTPHSEHIYIHCISSHLQNTSRVQYIMQFMTQSQTHMNFVYGFMRLSVGINTWSVMCVNHTCVSSQIWDLAVDANLLCSIHRILSTSIYIAFHLIFNICCGFNTWCNSWHNRRHMWIYLWIREIVGWNQYVICDVC